MVHLSPGSWIRVFAPGYRVRPGPSAGEVKEVIMYHHKATFKETEDISRIIRTENARGAFSQAYGLYSAVGKGDPEAMDVFQTSWLKGPAAEKGLNNGKIQGYTGTCETFAAVRHSMSHEQATRDESSHSRASCDHSRCPGPSSHPEVTR